MSHSFSEHTAVCVPSLELLYSFEWQVFDLTGQELSESALLGRQHFGEVVLRTRLEQALRVLNPDVSPAVLARAADELTRERLSTSLLTYANRDLWKLLHDGVRVETVTDGIKLVEIVRVIDWRDFTQNDFLAVAEFTVKSAHYTRRPDLVCFVNGLPLVLCEFKAPTKPVFDAFNDNLRDYRDTIPDVFLYNAFIVLSNGTEAKAGTISSEWEFFAEWKRVDSEDEAPRSGIETMLRGMLAPLRLLDIVENFILFEEKSSLRKILARYHQYLGVNKAMTSVASIQENLGKLGVFWHTQGSGKSYSMVFFAQKVMRTVPGNWTFLVLTDRSDLDTQIYKTFTRCGVVTEQNVQADSAKHLKQLLSEDHRYVFSLIQKFRTDSGAVYPLVSDRRDIIVMADEAHRSQYDIFSHNLRNALPNAAFIGFTGTPLLVGEEATKREFGDYISVYNFGRAIEDGATKPLYYENRIPELQLSNEDLNEDLLALVDEAQLDEDQEQRIEKVFARQYHLLTRDERLETIASDIVSHFLGRGFQGKAMVVSVDKLTAVRMYEKVLSHWQAEINRIEELIPKTFDEDLVASMERKLDFMRETDMAVVVSGSQNEIDDFRQRGLENAIRSVRARMNDDDLEEKFKDDKNPLRLVFVCAMWMTGFDVPSCSTIYLDKPMKNHSLMQAIARANRVFAEKENGLIVDYVGIFRNLQNALAIYSGGGGDRPIQDKSALVELLREALIKAKEYALSISVDIDAINNASALDRLQLLQQAVDSILTSDDTRRRYMRLAGQVNRLFKAILPDSRASEFFKDRSCLVAIAEKLKSLIPQADISEVMGKIEHLLDESIEAKGYVIHGREPQHQYTVDLSAIDFDVLAERLKNTKQRNIEVERIRQRIEETLNTMLVVNPTRINLHERFEELIEAYNSGAANTEEWYRQLVEFMKGLRDEEQRHIREELTDEELAVFDILTKPEPELDEAERKEVKRVARELLLTLKREKLTLDWTKTQQKRSMVRHFIQTELDTLPEKYSRDIYARKCDLMYEHVYSRYSQA